MNTFQRIAYRTLVATVVLVAVDLQAALDAFSRAKGQGKVNLMSSRVRATVGSQWVDVEEEAELQVLAPASDTSRVFQLRGSIVFPARAVVVGCVVWRGDTALQAKLRPQAQAHGEFLDIVNDTTSFSKDPVLLELDSNDTYSLRAYPFVTQGSRRIRIRYLLPVQEVNGEAEVFPIFSQVSGSLPSDWLLETRGKQDSLRVIQAGRAMPVTAPASLVYSFTSVGKVSLVWGRNAQPDVPRAVFDRVQGGAWAGDYAMFSGTIPDSIASRAARRAEIVVLWRWIHPERFLDTCWTESPPAGALVASQCLSEHGERALRQASEILKLADRTIARGHRFALVVDHGLDDTCRAFALADSTVRNSWGIRNWLQGVTADYLKWRIPVEVASQSSTLETSRNRIRFSSDLTKTGALFSKDSGWIRHLLVATTGPILSGGEFLQTPDLSGLPSDVSVRSCMFDDREKVYNGVLGAYVDSGFARSGWPGVDLTQAEVQRPGVDMAMVDEIWLPRMRNVLTGNLRIKAGTGDIIVPFQSLRGANGRWPFHLNAFAGTLEKVLNGEIHAEDATLLSRWSFTPSWVELSQDSIVPRLWARSSGRISTVSGFVSPSSLANTFGYVDQAYSLIAIPPDTLGWARSRAISDSLVPFLGPSDIFTRAGYKDGPGQTGIRPLLTKSGHPLARWMGSRKLLLDFDGLSLQSIEVLDIQGRVLVRVGQEPLRGVGQFQIDLSSLMGHKGMILLRMGTTVGWKSLPILLP